MASGKAVSRPRCMYGGQTLFAHRTSCPTSAAIFEVRSVVVRSLLPTSEKRVAAHEECVGRPRCSIASPIAAFVPFIHARSHREQRLARCVFNFVRPGLLDAVDDVLRHRDVIELLGHLVALVVGPGAELELLGGPPP